MTTKKPSKKGLYASIIGTIVVLLCCFTPILVVSVGVIGLSALTPYLDYILFPLLGVLIVTTILAYRKYQKGCRECQVEDGTTNNN